MLSPLGRTAQPPAKRVVPQATDEELAKGFAAALTQMAAMSTTERRMTDFHATRVPTISIRDYVGRIFKFFRCSGACYILALIYIDRLLKKHPDIMFSPLSSHRLVLTSMLVAAKFHDDVFYSNAYYAKIGGLKVPELNALEAQFIKMLDWKFQVQAEEYDVYCSCCQRAAQGA